MADFLFMEDVNSDFTPTDTVGTFANVNSANDYDTVYMEACENLKNNHHMEVNNGFLRDGINNSVIVANFKRDLLKGFQESVQEITSKFENKYSDSDVGNFATLYDQVSKLYDNKIQQFQEEAQAGQLLPIKAIDFPIMAKAQVKNSFKDVVNEEVTPNVVIKKQIEHKIVYSKKNPTRQWEYPQCFYNDEFQEIYNAGVGTALDHKAVDLPLFNFDIVDELTNAAIPYRERLVLDVGIDAIDVADGTGVDEVITTIQLRRPMDVNLADGAWMGGKINVTYKVGGTGAEKTITDVLSGFMDWTTGTTTLTSASGKVKSVHFVGRLSNEGNENTVRFTYRREDREWKVGEGFKVDSAYTIEQLQEHKALLNMDLYKKTYNDLLQLIVDMEDSKGYDWLNSEFVKYKGLSLDPLQWEPLVKETSFNCDSTIATVALPSEYIAKELKFKIDRFLIDLSDDVKMDNLKFVMYGNPRYVSLLNPEVHWVFRTGDRVGGVKLDYSYGVMTSGDTTIYVVSSKKLNAKKFKTLRLIPFAPESETITFKRYKFSTDVITAKDTAYTDTERSGGSMTYVFGTSRYADVSLQPIQGDVGFENADFITL